jgi:hypothetical protein
MRYFPSVRGLLSYFLAYSSAMRFLGTIGVTAFATVFLFAGCATTEYKPYEARVNIFEGKGGTKSVVDGMEIWDNGEPPRTYKLLGIIEDVRGAGPIPMASLKTDIVEKAKEAGGDAVILLGSQVQFVGTYSTGSASAYGYGGSATAYGSSVAVPIGKKLSKFAVIKYLQ